MHLSNHSPSGEPIQAVLAGIEGGPIQLDEFILKENIIDQGSGCQGLALKAILSEKSLTIPVALGYTALWGDKERYQGTIPLDINILTFKVHLAHVHTLHKRTQDEKKN